MLQLVNFSSPNKTISSCVDVWKLASLSSETVIPICQEMNEKGEGICCKSLLGLIRISQMSHEMHSLCKYGKSYCFKKMFVLKTGCLALDLVVSFYQQVFSLLISSRSIQSILNCLLKRSLCVCVCFKPLPAQSRYKNGHFTHQCEGKTVTKTEEYPPAVRHTD